MYDGVEFVTLASLPGMWERTVTVCSISKGMALSGYRVAYIVADDHIMDVYYGSAVSVIDLGQNGGQGHAEHAPGEHQHKHQIQHNIDDTGDEQEDQLYLTNFIQNDML